MSASVTSPSRAATRSSAIPVLQRSLTLLTLLGLSFTAFFAVVRPWFRTWGATPSEVVRSLPGDEIVRDADAQLTTTRAVTIDAPVAAVWPWLAQLGQDRGGFYSFELLEDLIGAEMPGAERIHPEHQAWKPGDELWMYPKDKLGGIGHAPLARYEPGRVLAFATTWPGSAAPANAEGSWAFVLEPIDARTTRLLVRGRTAKGRGAFGASFDRFVFDPAHFVMERKTMLGIKLRAEGGHGSKLADGLQVLLWTSTFGVLVLSGVSAVRRERWLRPLSTFTAAAIVFQVLTLAQPALVIGGLLVLGVIALGWLPIARARRAPSADPRPWTRLSA